MVGTLLVSADGTSCGASMVKMSVDFPNEAARCQRFLSGEHKVVSRPGANPDLSPAVSEVISVAIARPTCPFRNIQMELDDLRSQARQPAFEAAQLSPAQNNRRS